MQQPYSDLLPFSEEPGALMASLASHEPVSPDHAGSAENAQPHLASCAYSRTEAARVERTEILNPNPCKVLPVSGTACFTLVRQTTPGLLGRQASVEARMP